MCNTLLVRPQVCRVAQKEKVLRVALLAARNLLGYSELGLASDMVEAGLNRVRTGGMSGAVKAFEQDGDLLACARAGWTFGLEESLL